ncbi:hypothetical protein RI129_008435 [Pyrocoelia pectoralis]|uniref:Mitochondrial cardiolipin hydrolase n=1 Tax=Pyrocoelia pectoralis TaxID=417401 RepID=A0AAN7V8L7_9COLE
MFVCSIITFGFAGGALILRNLRQKRYSVRLRCKVKDKYKYVPLFFTINNRNCKVHIYKHLPCKVTCSYYGLQHILEFIKRARYTLNLCMCMLTSNEIQDALVDAHNKGVKVRFIADKMMAENRATRMEFLKSAGIPIKTQVQTVETVIHHKFCYCDENYPSNRKLFFGSLNLTIQGLTSNWDSVIFTDNRFLILQYKNIFEDLWTEF